MFREWRVLGLDLSGSPKNPTGYAIVIDGDLVEYGIVHSDEEIEYIVRRLRPNIVVIDAPLSLSRGFREVDKEMLKRGFKLLPPGWKGMRKLVFRALKIKNYCERRGIKVLETHPRSALKNTGLEDIRNALSKFVNIGEDVELEKLSKDTLDAIICATVGWAYANRKVEVISAKDGKIFLLRKVANA